MVALHSSLGDSVRFVSKEKKRKASLEHQHFTTICTVPGPRNLAVTPGSQIQLVSEFCCRSSSIPDYKWAKILPIPLPLSSGIPPYTAAGSSNTPSYSFSSSSRNPYLPTSSPM
ncbi:hypothetical protein AAY473_010634 [Plecturocebus cupreus]